MKRMLFVMNPFAGMRKGAKHLSEMISAFNRGGYMVNAYMTKEAGDGIHVVAEHAKEVDLVVCCGGDGTFNEAVSGVLKSGADVPLGYIPAGSTNDFANSLDIPLHILDAAEEILQGQPMPFDLGRFEDRYFSYIASFGAFTKSSYATPQTAKNTLGHAAYLFSGIQELSQIHTIHAKVEVDGKMFEDDYLFGAICNCTSMGGVINLDPSFVDMQDGLFEILLIRAPQDLTELGECLLAMQRRDYQCKMATLLSGKKVRVEMDDPCDWSLDGEHAAGRPVVEIENLHHAYNLMKGTKE